MVTITDTYIGYAKRGYCSFCSYCGDFFIMRRPNQESCGKKECSNKIYHSSGICPECLGKMSRVRHAARCRLCGIERRRYLALLKLRMLVDSNTSKSVYASHLWMRHTLERKKQYPSCVKCGCSDTSIIHTDHIRPWQSVLDKDERWFSFWDRNNMQTLCNSCHIKKSLRER